MLKTPDTNNFMFDNNSSMRRCNMLSHLMDTDQRYSSPGKLSR
jgi:hypothetical protein